MGGKHKSKKETRIFKYSFIIFLIILFSAVFFIFIFFLKYVNSPPKNTLKAEHPIIKLAVNSWTASKIDATIAKDILEKKGLQVKLVDIDEYSQWQKISTGEIDGTLEVWPSGHQDHIKQFIEQQKTVEDGGNLGPTGKIGWYIPKYLADQHPELTGWQGFKDPKNASLFATQKGGRGQFYTGDPTWTQYDVQIIKNLGLNFDVVTLGSEDALIKKLDEMYKQKKPILFYFWTPHWAQALYDLEPVALPEHTEACYAGISKGSVACDYPQDNLKKIFWSGLSGYSPEAYTILKKMTLTNTDQVNMLAQVQLDHKSIEEVAKIWVDYNQTIWRQW